MNKPLQDLLRPEILQTVNGLELVAKIIVEGFMSGSNKSRSVGVGQEFSQYRNYQPGDELRQLDWKMFARSERYFIKQSDIETNITVKFILDASNSMAYTEEMSKLQYGKVLIAALSYLARKQGDTIGLSAVNALRVSVLHPRFEQQQFLRFLTELIKIKSEDEWNHSSEIEQLYSPRGKEMIIFVTDLYDKQGDLLHFISRLKTPRNEVIVFHLLGQKEVTMDFKGAFTFEDLESAKSIHVDTDISREVYVQNVKQWIDDCRRTMLEKQIIYEPVMMNELIENVLRKFVSARKSLL